MSDRYRAIGWREWVTFPAFEMARVKAKVDTGARTSAMHATNIAVEQGPGGEFATFAIFPSQDDHDTFVECRAPVVGRRSVTDSGGHTEERVIVRTIARLGEIEWPIEMSLTQRDTMGFRMLLGRMAIRRRFTVFPGKSFLNGGPVEPLL
ncbi:MAG: ATP-dependent zinc protease [Hyphomicrobiales bacterium]|nr:ATP-dependent zinc protease [Hyphomicrobiales bacterium]